MTNSHRTNPKLTQKITLILMVNFGLALIAAVLLSEYVLDANSMTFQRYQITKLGEELAAAQEDNSLLIMKQTTLLDSGTLSDFAARNNMVVAGGVTYLFENKDVALANKQY